MNVISSDGVLTVEAGFISICFSIGFSLSLSLSLSRLLPCAVDSEPRGLALTMTGPKNAHMMIINRMERKKKKMVA
jgi:hypothetical protein